MSITSASFFLVAISIAVCWAGLDASQNRLSNVDPRSARILLSNNFESGSADPWYDNSPSSVHWIADDFYYPAEVSNPPPTPLSASNFNWRPASTSLRVSEPTDVTLIFYGYCGSNNEDAIATHDISTTEMVTTTTTTPTTTTPTTTTPTTTTPTTTTPTTTTPTTTPTTTTPTTTRGLATQNLGDSDKILARVYEDSGELPTPATTASSSPIRRTVVFIYKTTQNEQNMFIRGGIDDKVVRPVCMNNQDAESSICSVSLQAGQGTYMDSSAFGTPLAWTTNGEITIIWWILTVDCSETVNGWFDVKAFITNFASGWETDIIQSPCTGTGANALPPYSGTSASTQKIVLYSLRRCQI
ncbi:hypothetical protein DAPPUDRAFT_100284 [Daphnia pulex]|uniref:Uncharacterized protein n=1 Tax=Daphnia pulex TaxID=6669 RepID=E9G9Z5_DAPPU|nr:hypothetical protein DAPPUDRAFT_100284 [Daphnia pulex]|eukprot:EFX83653.1 hypothetical protein DAPPUDRAFT_100284 [Daphnia pulex]